MDTNIEFLQQLNKQMLELKSKDPEKYLESLTELNSIIEELNRSLESVK